MFKKISLILLLGANSAQAQEPIYDSRGQLITNYEQAQRDREAGILQRGGYNPEAAAAAAAQQQARAGNAPRIGNSNAPNANGLSDHSIYRCQSGGKDVYVDEDGKRKFSQCQLIRKGKAAIAAEQAQAEPHLVPPTPSQVANSPLPQEAALSNPEANVPTENTPVILMQGSGNTPCSGAILYKGSTYIFSEHEPCPIPAEVFNSRRPIEAEPNYYTQ